MKRQVFFYLFLMCFSVVSMAQKAKTITIKKAANAPVVQPKVQISPSACSKIIIPKAKKQAQSYGTKAPKTYPERFEAFICFDKGQTTYREDALDVLDSVFKIVFDQDNGMFYKMTITGYDDADKITEATASLARERAVNAFHYFASREQTEYIIRRTKSFYKTSSEGATECYIKYKMPFDFKWYNLQDTIHIEKTISGVDLTSKVYILVENDTAECLGKFNDYYYPGQDTTLMSSGYAMLKVPKGALESTTHTKDTINNSLTLSFTSCLSFEDVTREYKLVPHKTQYIVSAGYMVIKSNHCPVYEKTALRDEYPQNITIRLPMELQQNEGRLKFYARTYNPNGTWTYKIIPTKKEKDKESGIETLVGSLTAFQLDTIYLGKRVEEKEMSNYFYPAQEGEPGAFNAMGGWLKPYKLDKKGSIVIKKDMQAILRKPSEKTLR